jgi:hypothetical protein
LSPNPLRRKDSQPTRKEMSMLKSALSIALVLALAGCTDGYGHHFAAKPSPAADTSVRTADAPQAEGSRVAAAPAPSRNQ